MEFTKSRASRFSSNCRHWNSRRYGEHLSDGTVRRRKNKITTAKYTGYLHCEAGQIQCITTVFMECIRVKERIQSEMKRRHITANV